jgi:hypothetical protein
MVSWCCGGLLALLSCSSGLSADVTPGLWMSGGPYEVGDPCHWSLAVPDGGC